MSEFVLYFADALEAFTVWNGQQSTVLSTLKRFVPFWTADMQISASFTGNYSSSGVLEKNLWKEGAGHSSCSYCCSFPEMQVRRARDREREREKERVRERESARVRECESARV